MFSGDDFISYFSDIEVAIKNLQEMYRYIAEHIEGQKSKKVFYDLESCEKDHLEVIYDLRKKVVDKLLPNL